MAFTQVLVGPGQVRLRLSCTESKQYEKWRKKESLDKTSKAVLVAILFTGGHILLAAVGCNLNIPFSKRPRVNFFLPARITDTRIELLFCDEYAMMCDLLDGFWDSFFT